MDNKALLKSIINDIINENEDAASASFKQYATTKVRGLVETKSEINIEDDDNSDE